MLRRMQLDTNFTSDFCWTNPQSNRTEEANSFKAVFLVCTFCLLFSTDKLFSILLIWKERLKFYFNMFFSYLNYFITKFNPSELKPVWTANIICMKHFDTTYFLPVPKRLNRGPTATWTEISISNSNKF